MTDIQQTPNPKCSTCRCFWKPETNDIKSSGLYFKTCKKCRAKTQKDKEKHYEEYHTSIDCACGGSFTRYNKARHILRKIHQEFIKEFKH